MINKHTNTQNNMAKTIMTSSCVLLGAITNDKWSYTKTHSVINQGSRRNLKDIYRVFDIDITARVNKRTIKKFLDM